MNRDAEYPKLVCMLDGGPCQEIIVSGKRYFFEWHPYCGPTLVHRKTLDVLRELPADHLWWDAVVWWNRQGRRMRDGLCVWNRELPEVPIVERIGKRSGVIVGVLAGARCQLAEG